MEDTTLNLIFHTGQKWVCSWIRWGSKVDFTVSLVPGDSVRCRLLTRIVFVSYQSGHLPVASCIHMFSWKNFGGNEEIIRADYGRRFIYKCRGRGLSMANSVLVAQKGE